MVSLLNPIVLFQGEFSPKRLNCAHVELVSFRLGACVRIECVTVRTVRNFRKSSQHIPFWLKTRPSTPPCGASCRGFSSEQSKPCVWTDSLSTNRSGAGGSALKVVALLLPPVVISRSFLCFREIACGISGTSKVIS